jgi:hypothetical protein
MGNRQSKAPPPKRSHQWIDARDLKMAQFLREYEEE